MSDANPAVERVAQPRHRWWHLGGKDISHVSIDDGYEIELSGSATSSVSELQKNVENVFVSPEALGVYKPVEGFEGAHRFDPAATWSPDEERSLVKRVSMLCKMSSGADD